VSVYAADKSRRQLQVVGSMSTSKAKPGSRQLSPLPIVDGVILFKRVSLYKGKSLCLTLVVLHSSMDAHGSSSDVCVHVSNFCIRA
jgi:hypothetical protein